MADPDTRRWARLDGPTAHGYHLPEDWPNSLPEPTLDELLTHARRYYSDAATRRDMDCLLEAAASDEDRRVLKAYARLRRAAPGYAPGSYSANSHGAIPPQELGKLAARKRSTVTAGVGRIKPCAECGKAFAYTRADAKYCGPRCRQRARRVAA